MQPKTINIDKLIEWLRQEAVSQNSTLIVEARIAVSPQEARLLDMQPSMALEVISF